VPVLEDPLDADSIDVVEVVTHGGGGERVRGPSTHVVTGRAYTPDGLLLTFPNGGPPGRGGKPDLGALEDLFRVDPWNIDRSQVRVTRFDAGLRPATAQRNVFTAQISDNKAHTGRNSFLVTGTDALYAQSRLLLRPGNKYLLECWVSRTKENVTSFRSPDTASAEQRLGVSLTFSGLIGAEPRFFLAEPTGPVVEGWQRISHVFTPPQGTIWFTLGFQNGVLDGRSDQATYFDDLRILPFDSAVECYVYDPSTYKLVAVLGDMNFATFYAYDSELRLRSVRRETPEGILTEQEFYTHVRER